LMFFSSKVGIRENGTWREAWGTWDAPVAAAVLIQQPYAESSKQQSVLRCTHSHEGVPEGREDLAPGGESSNGSKLALQDWVSGGHSHGSAVCVSRGVEWSTTGGLGGVSYEREGRAQGWARLGL
jgi:hypothetical protein